MPNHVENIVTLSGDEQEIRRMLERIKSDELGVGTVDFNKIIPMPESLNIEAGSRTDRGLKFYKDFIEVYTLGGTINMENLRNIPVKSEEIFLRQRTDIRRDEWELGKNAFEKGGFMYMMSPGGHRWRTAIIFANNFELKKSNYEMTDIYGVIMDAVKGE